MQPGAVFSAPAHVSGASGGAADFLAQRSRSQRLARAMRETSCPFPHGGMCHDSQRTAVSGQTSIDKSLICLMNVPESAQEDEISTVSSTRGDGTHPTLASPPRIGCQGTGGYGPCGSERVPPPHDAVWFAADRDRRDDGLCRHVNNRN